MTLSADSQSSLQPKQTEEKENMPVQYSKGEAQAFNELERYTRQVLTAYFDNRRRDEIIQLVFPRINEAHPLWKNITKTLIRNFKNWKNRVLRDARAWISAYFSLDENADLVDIDTFKDFKSALAERIQDHWLPEIFRFPKDHINFNGCSQLAVVFLRCMYPKEGFPGLLYLDSTSMIVTLTMTEHWLNR